MEQFEINTTKDTNHVSYDSDVERESSLAERFTYDLDRINAAIVDMLNKENTDTAELQQAWAIRAVLSENFVDSLEPTVDEPRLRTRAQFDIMVDKASIFEQVGSNIRFLEELDAAEAFAYNNHLDDMVASISEELDEKIPVLSNSPEEMILKLRSGIDFFSRDRLREQLVDGLDYEDLLGNLYELVLAECGNPDEILMRLGITEY